MTRQPIMRLEPHRLVFLDETGTTTKMARLRGRSLRGQRLLSKVQFGHWKTQTFIAGLRCDALTAPFVIDAPMDRRIFETYVDTQLAPTLRPGDVVVLDNLPAHKSAAAEQAVRAMGAWLLFLPPYSPDLNPIEMAFAKLKALLRARAVRTIDDADRGGAADLSQGLDLGDEIFGAPTKSLMSGTCAFRVAQPKPRARCWHRKVHRAPLFDEASRSLPKNNSTISMPLALAALAELAVVP